MQIVSSFRMYEPKIRLKDTGLGKMNGKNKWAELQ